MASPILKWCGGKRQLIPELIKALGTCGWRDYYEPFCGGAAFFFALQEKGYLWPMHKFKSNLNDSNEDLINVYSHVKDNLPEVLVHLRRIDKQVKEMGLERTYRIHREAFNNSKGSAQTAVQAARFIAMNALGYNGLVRYNRDGGFNTPPGKFARTPILMDKEANLRAASEALQLVNLWCCDFVKATEKVRDGDLVYFDPPYIPTSTTANFTSYTADGFGDDQHLLLEATARNLALKGAFVIISNSDTPRTRKIWPKSRWKLTEVQARRAVNSKADRRGKVGELIITERLR